MLWAILTFNATTILGLLHLPMAVAVLILHRIPFLKLEFVVVPKVALLLLAITVQMAIVTSSIRPAHFAILATISTLLAFVYRACRGSFHSPLIRSHTALRLAVVDVPWTHVFLSLDVHRVMLGIVSAITIPVSTVVLKMLTIQLEACQILVCRAVLGAEDRHVIV